jgi:hypothetical protein
MREDWILTERQLQQPRKGKPVLRPAGAGRNFLVVTRHVVENKSKLAAVEAWATDTSRA